MKRVSGTDRSTLMRFAVVAALAVILVLLTFVLGTRKQVAIYGEQLDAVNRFERMVSRLKQHRADMAIPLDSEDYLETGLIGESYTPLTTTVGDAGAKRTASTRDMAALVVRLLSEAGARSGDIVAANLSGSFPGLNLAFLAACQTLDLKPVYTVSASASMYGANIPGFSFPDMVLFLHDAGYLDELPQSVSIGGDQDIGSELDPVFCDELKVHLETSGLPFLYEPDFEQNIHERLSLYEQFGSPELFVSIGGHTASLGVKKNAIMQMQGVIRPRYIQIDAESGLISRYLTSGVPVIQLLNIKRLTGDYGMVFDPPAMPPVGQSAVYWEDTYPLWLAAGGLILIFAILVCFRLHASKQHRQGD